MLRLLGCAGGTPFWREIEMRLKFVWALSAFVSTICLSGSARAQCTNPPTITCPATPSHPNCDPNYPCINRRTDPGLCYASVVNFCGPALYLCPGQDAVLPPGPDCLTATDCSGNSLP